MTLGELIARLEQEDPDRVVSLGFGSPHSYRGYYDELAFVPMDDQRIGDMLAAARSALGQTFTGYKGGEYHMNEHTDCWLADYGCCGETLGPTFVDLLLRAAPTPDAPTGRDG